MHKHCNERLIGMGRRNDLTGQKFGRLTVIEKNLEVSKIKKRSYWNCICECGNTHVAVESVLKNGHTKSCGCLRQETTKKQGQKNTTNLIGQKFGRLTVVQRTDKRSSDRQYIWLCQCECGGYAEVITSNLTHSCTHSCGCLVGENAKKQLRMLHEYQQGELHPSWQGGISSIKQHLHDTILDWFTFTKQQTNYTCQLTGKQKCNLHTHHLYSFNFIKSSNESFCD